MKQSCLFFSFSPFFTVFCSHIYPQPVQRPCVRIRDSKPISFSLSLFSPCSLRHRCSIIIASLTIVSCGKKKTHVAQGREEGGRQERWSLEKSGSPPGARGSYFSNSASPLPYPDEAPNPNVIFRKLSAHWVGERRKATLEKNKRGKEEKQTWQHADAQPRSQQRPRDFRGANSTHPRLFPPRRNALSSSPRQCV